MAYIPPHKRHNLPGDSVLPKPESLTPAPRKGTDINIVYAPEAVSKWFPVVEYFDGSLVRLRPHPELPRKFLLVLQGCKEGINPTVAPWLFVAQNVKQDLFLSIERMKCELKEDNMADVKPCIVARLGKVLFRRDSSQLTETALSQMRTRFYTNVPPPYMDYIESQVIAKLGLESGQENELCCVKLSDKLRPGATVYCKCTVARDLKKIQLYKIELNPVRYMVSDMSCLGKSSDVRLILYTKKINMDLFDGETYGIKDLIDSAVLDSSVKGGVRWPFGKDSSGDRYTVISVVHITTKSYRNSSIKFKLRHADRFDFKSSTGEVEREIFMKMPGIVSHLRKPPMDENVVFKMLEDNLKLIWDHCLLADSSS